MKKSVAKNGRTVTLAQVRKALEDSPTPRQYDEMAALVFICEELVARPPLRNAGLCLDVYELTGDDLGDVAYASDCAVGDAKVRDIRAALEKIALRQRANQHLSPRDG